MKIIINGASKNIFDDASLIDLLTELKISNDKQGMAIALNQDVIPKSKWTLTKIKENDRVEIIQAVQGG